MTKRRSRVLEYFADKQNEAPEAEPDPLEGFGEAFGLESLKEQNTGKS